MNNQRSQRKLEHIQLFKEEYNPHYTGFEDVHLIHQALPVNDWDEIDITWCFLDKICKAPLFITAITGGHPASEKINRDLALVAAETGIGLAVGSQHAALYNEELVKTYQVIRTENPGGLVFANVGAGVSWDLALKAIEMIGAQGVQVHLNAAQELMMPEGDRKFTQWLNNIEQLVKKSWVPVIVKETGCGLSRETVLRLKEVGVEYFDVGGSGGTDFLAIEARRAQLPVRLQLSWGLPTAWALLECLAVLGNQGHLWASGGILTPLDWAKALALGAEAVGVAGHFLKTYLDNGLEGLVNEIKEWQRQLKIICLLTGVSSPAQLKAAAKVITGKTAEWQKLRAGDVYGCKAISSFHA